MFEKLRNIATSIWYGLMTPKVGEPLPVINVPKVKPRWAYSSKNTLSQKGKRKRYKQGKSNSRKRKGRIK